MTSPRTLENMGWLLTNFADSIAGIAHVVAVSADGLLLASSRGLPEDRAEQLAAIAAGVVSLTEGTARYFNGGAVQQTIIEMEQAFLFVIAAGKGTCLAVLTSAEANVGLIAYEMAMLVRRMGKYLASEPRSPEHEIAAE